MQTPNAANIARFNGFADCYDAHRPSPPAAMVDVLTQLAHVERPGLMVDLGCGARGCDARLGGRAKKIIGIDPNR